MQNTAVANAMEFGDDVYYYQILNEENHMSHDLVEEYNSEHGTDIDIGIMEMGFSTWSYGYFDENMINDEAAQKKFIEESMGTLLPMIYTHNKKEDTKIKMCVWYNLRDGSKHDSQVPWERKENNFGLYHRDWSQKEGVSDLRDYMFAFN